MPALIPYEDAQRQMLALANPLGSEPTSIDDALGRYLAQPLLARRTQPAADLSAMDGYAVRAGDLSGPWHVVGESAAGHPWAGMLGEGQALRISTGAMLPEEGGAILLQENARRIGNTLRLTNSDGPTPRHIRRAGLDFVEGDLLLAAGSMIGPAQIALALSGGHAQLSVGKLPSIAVLDNGDELASDATALAAHQIPASNGAMLAAMAAPHVRNCLRLGPVPDDRASLLKALEQADRADVVVTSGGASVGDHDLVRPALEEWGADIAFWRIAMKPGKPLLVARRGNQIVLGLPGNPVSSYVTALLFMVPLLRHLAGAADALPTPVHLPLAAAMPENGGRATFTRARFCERRCRPTGGTRFLRARSVGNGRRSDNPRNRRSGGADRGNGPGIAP